MPTSSKKELQQEIQDLKDALESEFTPAQFKDDIRKQIKDSEAELDKLEKAEKEVKTASAEKKPEKVEKKETAAQRVKKRVEQAKKTVKTAKKKQEEVKQEKKSALQKIKERKEKMASAKKPVRKSAPKKSSLSKKRDAERKALKPGRRVSADGNVYYENRSNRSDVQRKKYPYLEDGGFTNDGAGMFAGGGELGNWYKEGSNTWGLGNTNIYITEESGEYEVVDRDTDEEIGEFDTFEDAKMAGVEYSKKMYAKGGIFGSDRNLARDRMFKSQEDWEQRYKRKTSPKNPRYKYEDGGEFTNEGAGMFESGGSTSSEKVYNVMYNVGKAKYLVNFHDGVKTHKDGSPFFAVDIFSNKVEFNKFINKLESEGYRKVYAEGGTTDFVNEGAGMFAKGGKVGKLDSILKEYRKNEDNNLHSENVVLLAKHFGTKEDLEKAKDILKKQEEIGSLTPALLKQRDQLGNKLWNKLLAEKNLTEYPIFHIYMQNKNAVNKIVPILEDHGYDVYGYNEKWSRPSIVNKYVDDAFDIVFVIDVRDSDEPYILMDELWKSTSKDITINAGQKNRFEGKKYATGGATDFVNEGAGMFAKGGSTGEAHRTESMYEFGGAIVDQSYGLLADPRFDVQSPIFAKGGKLSSKYNYLPKYKIATITTEDGSVIDGNDIIDGLYVKKKVKF